MWKTMKQPVVTPWDREELRAFHEGDRDIHIITRPPIAGIAEAVAWGEVEDYRAMIGRRGVPKLIATGLQLLNLQSEPLAAEMTALAEGFLDQFGLVSANLRIELLRTQMCPKFHCDEVNLRMVCTFFGPTTEYRFNGDDLIHHAPLFGLVFLKGHQHPNHRDSVHHRSPMVPDGGRRLCLVIDY